MPVPTNSRTRWLMLAAASIMLSVSMGQFVNGLAAFFEPLEREFGWARGDIAFINTAGLIGLGLGGVLMGFLADRVSIRQVAIIGALATGGCIFAASRANSLPQFYVLFFLGGAFGGGALFAPLFALVGGWFQTGTGLAIGIASAGQAIGQGGIPLVNTMLIEALGWRMTFAASGLATLGTLLALAFVLRTPPALAVGSGAAAVSVPAPASVAWRQAMPLLCSAVLLCCSLMAVPLIHLMPLVQGCGIAPTEAGGVLLALMLSAIFGRIAFGKLADRVGPLPAYFAASAWQTVLVFGFPMIGDLGSFQAFAVVYGFGYGGVMTCVLTTIRAFAPAKRASSATGFVLAFGWAGHGLGGYLGGAFFDLTLGYELAFAAAALAGTINLVLIVTLWSISRRQSRSTVEGAAGSPLPAGTVPPLAVTE